MKVRQTWRSAYRHPKTFQELKAFYNPEARNLVRAKRNPRGLPTLYDDLVSSNNFDKSWKRHTKDRYQWEHGWNRPKHRGYCYISCSKSIKTKWNNMQDWLESTEYLEVALT